MTYDKIPSQLVREKCTCKEKEENLAYYNFIAGSIVEDIDTKINYVQCKTVGNLTSKLLDFVDIIYIQNKYGIVDNSRTVREIIKCCLSYIDSNSDKSINEAFAEMKDIYRRKNEDYGNSAEKTLEFGGNKAFLTRLLDKISRLNSFANKNEMEVKDEKLMDTIYDTINYSIIYCIYMKKK